ncbi:hypothetical protein ACCO45_008134 [Purpureocillium lilacinum]|uniref:Uncharacterized protein n=1 Tax=Purpureocillium lilacinum TaxID=33203 RepID=A0ACC4DME0_PURLI
MAGRPAAVSVPFGARRDAFTAAAPSRRPVFVVGVTRLAGPIAWDEILHLGQSARRLGRSGAWLVRGCDLASDVCRVRSVRPSSDGDGCWRPGCDGTPWTETLVGPRTLLLCQSAPGVRGGRFSRRLSWQHVDGDVETLADGSRRRLQDPQVEF